MCIIIFGVTTMPSLRKKSRVASGSALFVHHKKNSETTRYHSEFVTSSPRKFVASARETKRKAKQKLLSETHLFFILFFSRLRGGEIAGKERRERERKRERETIPGSS